jgi:hypothetical protein
VGPVTGTAASHISVRGRGASVVRRRTDATSVLERCAVSVEERAESALYPVGKRFPDLTDRPAATGRH